MLPDQCIVRPLRGQDAPTVEDGADASVNHRLVMRREIVVPKLGLGLFATALSRWRSLRQDLAQVGLPTPRWRLRLFFPATISPAIVLVCVADAISSSRCCSCSCSSSGTIHYCRFHRLGGLPRYCCPRSVHICRLFLCHASLRE